MAKCVLSKMTGLASCAALVSAPLAWAGGVATQIGITDLNARLGTTAPTGASVIVGQVEAQESAGNWGPNQGNIAEYGGKTFTVPPNNPAGPGMSGHANLVAANFYGNLAGAAPGITNIYLYEAGAWLQTAYLRAHLAASNPLNPPAGLKIYNNSWICCTPPSVTFEQAALRHADYAVETQQLLIISGVNNGGGQLPLMTYGFNGISVGLTGGGHTSGLTGATYDFPGRMKPELVAPEAATSFATPYVSGVAARLVQTARTAPLSTNPSAERADVLKAVLMAGANHRAGWTNCTGGCASGATRGITASPLDAVFGADVVYVDRSHQILTGAEQNGADAAPTAINIIRRGWDFASVVGTNSKYYRFRVGATADKVSILAAWNRIVLPTSNNAGDVANFNLILKRVGTGGSLVDITGNAGLPYYSAGNVVSQSAVDNVEHLYLQNLQPGEYTLQVQRTDALGGTRNVAVAWLLPKRPGDINEDGTVGVPDLLAVINGWGACPPPCPPNCPADQNGDCSVGVPDLLLVINNWG